MTRYAVVIGDKSRLKQEQVRTVMREYLSPAECLIMQGYELGLALAEEPAETLADMLQDLLPEAEWYFAIQGSEEPVEQPVGSPRVEHHERLYVFERSLGNRHRDTLEPDVIYRALNWWPERVELIEDGLKKFRLGNHTVIISPEAVPSAPRPPLALLAKTVRMTSRQDRMALPDWGDRVPLFPDTDHDMKALARRLADIEHGTARNVSDAALYRARSSVLRQLMIRQMIEANPGMTEEECAAAYDEAIEKFIAERRDKNSSSPEDS